MAPEEFIQSMLLLALSVLVVMVSVTARRRRSFEPQASQDRIFRCDTSSCRYVYTDDADVDRSRCPQCGRMNGHVSF
jgi:hypothetical protein